MARPRRGVRTPLLLPPGMGGRKRGAGEGVEPSGGEMPS